ncbi:hypothetical protein SADUNF_Sadunf04G0135700 [Salix dunnii]|uniref:Uncharacterized protein n=1 Tax=Salix dunnii TaxID=1413687 RepID=A0A835N143_9ROSI|nr:hypothetical protein SADUNF_Sadunf04G0135700 [Salix dunnii]
MATDPEQETASSLSSTATRRVSCTTCFDALWFCYSPVHQVQQYYRLGLFDNCSQKWSDLVDCLTLKTKRSSQVQVSLSPSLSMTAKLCFIAILKHKSKGSSAITLITLSIISCPGSKFYGRRHNKVPVINVRKFPLSILDPLLQKMGSNSQMSMFDYDYSCMKALIFHHIVFMLEALVIILDHSRVYVLYLDCDFVHLLSDVDVNGSAFHVLSSVNR